MNGVHVRKWWGVGEEDVYLEAKTEIMNSCTVLPNTD